MTRSAPAARRALALSCGVAALTAALAAAAPALAQEAMVEEVVVTAQKRSENLQDVPISVAAVEGEALRAIFAGGEDILALASRVPALYVESSNGRVAPRFYIRGLGNADFDLAASQPVSVIMDEVVMENVVLKSTPLFDIERVEILRGPQGTLFGRNTTAGIVKFDTVKPSQSFSANGTITAANYRTLTLDAGVGGPIIDGKLSARGSVLVQHRDDWIDNGFTGEDNALGGFDEQAARLQLLFTPTGQLSALFNVHARTLQGTSAVFRANILSPGSNKLNGNYDRETVWYDGGGGNPQAYKGWGSSLKVDYDFGGLTLTSITAFENTDGYSRGDIDGGNLVTGPGFIPFPSDTTDGLDNLDQFTQEIRLASGDDEALTWQVGAFYFDSEADMTTAPGFVPATTLRHTNTSWAVFGQASYAFSDQLKLTGGLRYTSDDKDLEVLAGPNPAAPVSVSDEKVSWDASVFYSIVPDVSVFARVAAGFRGPTIQGRDVAFLNPPSVAQSETIMSYEVGFKSELFNRSVRLNGALFTYTIEDPQFTAVGGGGNLNQILNADQGKAWGFELDGEWVATENLVFTAGYSYAKTEIEDDTLVIAGCAQCTITDPLNGLGQAFVDGNPFPNAPEYIFDFTARYSIPYEDGEFFVFTDWNVQGDTNLFLYESKEFNSSGNFEGGLKLGYAKLDGSLEAAIFVRNITDEHNLKGGIDFNNNTGFVNEPRIIGVSLTKRIN